MGPVISLITLSCAALASAKCIAPSKNSEWSFHLYKGPNCHEIKGEESVQRFDAPSFNGSKDCWNVTKHFSPIMSATYYGKDPMTGYSKHDCEGKVLFYSKQHEKDWGLSDWYDWKSDHFSKEYQEFKSFKIGCKLSTEA
ncbi:hypothetical protein BJ138DRAFT_1153708 [Hygrophoropsis aurantiaca]|uniref:Uncharacterized protein n=1 Tax=Hygrophoropsis aurantiaca TaxID=72124 RepID=A0ACB8AAK9_9AGAM|nr:hypothetical protein BJ138DRAFT_1153708 [Hygrophoropsis aurantiaca]